MTGFLDDVVRHVGLGSDDRARLAELYVRLAPEFPAIAARFYDAVWINPDTAALLSGPAQVERLRLTLIDWISTGLLGPYDEAFYDKRSRIGRRHVEIGLPQHYMFTAMNLLRGEYDDRIATLYPPAEARLVARSVDKLLDVELALMLRHYQIDSETRLIERERRNQAERLQAIQTLSAGLAHEVRNPINAAKLQLELLERRLRRDGDDPRLVEPLQLAHHEIERLAQLLNEFLAFARPSDLVCGEHDVAVIAREVVALEGVFAEQRGAALKLVTSAPIVARIDGAKLHQILQNLIRNALEAVDSGGHVTVTIRADHANLYIHVEDDGPGIPDTIRSRIYEPFFSTKEASTGLGMSIVHSMVTLHGGTIDIDSNPRGTRFEVVMPREA